MRKQRHEHFQQTHSQQGMPEVSARFVQINKPVVVGALRFTKPPQLRKLPPDPVAQLQARPQFHQRFAVRDLLRLQETIQIILIDQRPFQTGSRFSANALAPSSWSSLLYNTSTVRS